MSDDIKELVKALRAQGKKNYGLYAEVADALEALVAERDRLKAVLDKAGQFIADEYADPRVEPDGEWLAREARPIYAAICEALEGREWERLPNEKVAGGPTGLEHEAQVGSVSSPAPATDPEVVCDTLVCIWGSNLTQRRSGLHDVSWVRCDGSHVQYYADNAPCSVCGRRVKIAGGG